MIKHNDVKMSSKGTMPTCDVKVGYEDEGKSGKGAELNTSLLSSKKQVAEGGTDEAKKGSGGTEYFDSWKSAAKPSNAVGYPSAAK